MMLITKLTLGAVILTLTTACASRLDPTDTHAQGWRRAQVLDVGRDQLTVPTDKQDCRLVLPAKAGYVKFALVSYSYGGNPNLRDKRVVAIPSDLNVNVDDWVFVNVSDCNLALRKVGLRMERP